MATTLDQQVALDEALVPSAQRKHILDLEAFREMLHISPRIQGQSFAELPFEEEILEFLRFLGHSTQIKTLTDVNVNKLYQPWRSFAAVINKCLTGKSSGIDSLKISQAQILWGLYHGSNIDYAYLIWEDFVYQVEHKSQKKSNEMYYPRFTKVIIDYFMMRKPSIPRRNRVNWHYVKDDVLFTTIKVVNNLQEQQFQLKRQMSKEQKPNRSRLYSNRADKRRTFLSNVVLNSSDDEYVDEQTKGREESEVDKIDESDDGNDEEETTKIGEQEVAESDEGNDEATESDRESEDEETREQEEESFDPIPRTPEDNKDDDNNEEDQGLRIVSQETEDTHVILTPTQSDAQQESSSTSSFMTNLLNPITDPGLGSLFTTGLTTVTPIPSPQSTMTPSTISTFTSASQLPTPPTQIPSLYP
nr:hypothetical protein [Tanacetum cinerariifolium]